MSSRVRVVRSDDAGEVGWKLESSLASKSGKKQVIVIAISLTPDRPRHTFRGD